MKYLTIPLLCICLLGCMPGPTCPTGPQGPKGDPGAPGSNGSDCTVSSIQPIPAAPNGGSLISCTDGSRSLVLNGTDGINGTNGTDGSDGTPGTIILPVQFCHTTTQYPETFSEVGFCIAGKLYAVYSANDGFLTYLPDGEYSSNGIDSSCTFKVTGCAIGE